jgi:hypothetical protein
MAASLVVQCLDCCVDGAVERFVVDEGVVSQMVGLEIYETIAYLKYAIVSILEISRTVM